MDVPPSTGYPETNVACTAQMQAAHLDWKARVYATYIGGGTHKRWQGDDVWDVGCDERKGALLSDAMTTYDMPTGVIDVTNGPNGLYLVKWMPASTGNRVLRSGIKLNEDQRGNITDQNVAVYGAQFLFERVLPEPTSRFLLTGGGLSVACRRRLARKPLPAGRRTTNPRKRPRSRHGQSFWPFPAMAFACERCGRCRPAIRNFLSFREIRRKAVADCSPGSARKKNRRFANFPLVFPGRSC